MRTLSRLNALSATLAAALLLLAGQVRAADKAHTLTVRLEWITSGQHAPFYLAAEKGWFRKAGLDVSIEPGTGSATTIQLVGSGQYDIGEAALSNMAFARNRGVPVISIAGFFRKGDVALLVPEASPVKGPADLKGKKLIFTAGSFEGPFLDIFFAAGGVSRDQVELVNIDTNTRISAYNSGVADGIFGSPVGTLTLLDKRPSRAIDFADYGLNLPSYGLFTTDAKLKEKGEAIRAFASIVAGAWTYILAGHEEEALAAMLTQRAQDRADAAQLRPQLHNAPAFLYTKATADQPIGIQTEIDWANSLAVMEKAKAIEPGSKPTDYFTNHYLDLSLIKSIAAS